MQTQQLIQTVRTRVVEAAPSGTAAIEPDVWDEILMQTFPASDPPPWPGSIGGPAAPTQPAARAVRRGSR
jgi:hypothetical protein